MAWTIFGVAIQSGDEPWYDSAIDEVGEAIHVRHNPIGGTARDSDILTYIGTKSPQARLHFWCTTATKTALLALRQTEGTITDSWGASADWYCEDVRPTHFGQPLDPLGARWHVMMLLTGR